jgi:hypothetical protein
LNVHRFNDVRQIEIYSAESLVPDPSPFEVEINISNLKSYKSLGSDQNTAELNKAGCEILHSNFHKSIHFIWNKEKLPDKWNEPIIIPVNNKGDKTDCSIYRGLSLLPTSYKMSIILLSKLSSYIGGIIGHHQCGFRRNRSTTDQIFCISQILEKKWEYNKTAHELFIDIKKAYDALRRDILCNILIGFWIPMKLVRLIKMYLNEMYCGVLRYLTTSNTNLACYAIEDPVQIVNTLYYNLHHT